MELCCVKYCCNSENDLRLGITFHKFPPKGIKRRHWSEACGRRFVPTSHSVICSIHFDETFFRKTRNGKVLSPAAIPTLFLPNKSIETLCRKRKTKIPLHDLDIYFSTDQQFNVLCKKSSLHQFLLNPANILKESKRIVKTAPDIANQILDIAVKNTVGHPQIGVKYTNPYEKEIQKNLDIWKFNVESGLHDERPISYKCYPCHNFWWHLEEYREHLLTHKKINLTVEYFDYQPSLVAYDKEITLENQEQDEKCPKCGNDIENVALKAKLHCPKCISRHNIDGKKNNKKGIKCNICKRKFDGEENYKEHFLVHDVRSDRPMVSDLHTCKFCKANYPSKFHHYCLNRGTLAQCSYCFRRFVHDTLARNHMRNNKGIYICAICGLKLKSKCVKYEHMLSHSTKYTIVKKCTLCNGFKVFISSDGAALHLVIHHKDVMSDTEHYFCSIIIPKSCVNHKCRRAYDEDTDENRTAVKEIEDGSSISDEHIEYLDEMFDYDFYDQIESNKPETDTKLNVPSKKVDDNILLVVEENVSDVDFLDEEFFNEKPNIDTELNKPFKTVDNKKLFESDEQVEALKELEDEFYPKLNDEEAFIVLSKPSEDVENNISNAVDNAFEIKIPNAEIDENPETTIELNEPLTKADGNSPDNDNTVKNMKNMLQILNDTVFEKFNDGRLEYIINLSEASGEDNNISQNKAETLDLKNHENKVFKQSAVKYNKPSKKIDNLLTPSDDENNPQNYINNEIDMKDDKCNEEVKDKINEEKNLENGFNVNEPLEQGDTNPLNTVENMEITKLLEEQNVTDLQQFNDEIPKSSLIDLNEPLIMVDNNTVNERREIKNKKDMTEDKYYDELKDKINEDDYADNAIDLNKLAKKVDNNLLNTEENIEDMVQVEKVLNVKDFHEDYDEIAEATTELIEPSEIANNDPQYELSYLDNEMEINEYNYPELFVDNIYEDDCLDNGIDFDEPLEGSDHNLLNTEENTENMVVTDTVYEQFNDQQKIIELNEPLKEIDNNQENYFDDMLLERNDIIIIQQLNNKNPGVEIEINEPLNEVENIMLNAVENVQEEIVEDDVNQAFNNYKNSDYFTDLNESNVVDHNPLNMEENTENMLFVPNILDFGQSNEENLETLNEPSKEVVNNPQNSVENIKASQQCNDQMPESLIFLTEPPEKAQKNPINELDNRTNEENTIEINEEINNKLYGENNLETVDVNESLNYNEAELPMHNDMSEEELEEFADDIIILDFGTDDHAEMMPVEQAAVTKIDDTNVIQQTTEQDNIRNREEIEVEAVETQNEAETDNSDLTSLLEATIKIDTDQIQIYEDNWEMEDYLEVIDYIRDGLCSECENTLVRDLLVRNCPNCGTNRRIYKCTRCDVEHKTMEEYFEHFFYHDYQFYTCPKCPVIFFNIELIYQHVKLHIIFGEGKTKCYTVTKYLCRFKLCKGQMKLPDFFENWESGAGIARVSPTREGDDNNCDTNYFVDSFIRETTTQPQKEFNECVLCAARFTIHFDYKMHLIDHLLTDAKIFYDGQEFKCRLCANGTVTGEEYAIHMMGHAKLSFKCDYCINKFKKQDTPPHVATLPHLECDICEKFYRCVTEIEGIKDTPLGFRNIPSDITNKSGAIKPKDCNFDALPLTDDNYACEVEVTTTVATEQPNEEKDEMPNPTDVIPNPTEVILNTTEEIPNPTDKILNTTEELPFLSNEEMMVDVETIDEIDEVDCNDTVVSSWYSIDNYDELDNVEKYCNLDSFLTDADDPMLSNVDGLRKQREASRVQSLHNVVNNIDSNNAISMFEKAMDSMDFENGNSNDSLMFSRNSRRNELNDVFDFPIDIESENQTETQATAKVIKAKKPVKRIRTDDLTSPILKPPKRTKLNELKYVVDIPIQKQSENQPEMYTKVDKNKKPEKIRTEKFKPPISKLREPTKNKKLINVFDIPMQIKKDNLTEIHATEILIENKKRPRRYKTIPRMSKPPKRTKYDELKYVVDKPIQENYNQMDSYESENLINNIIPDNGLWNYGQILHIPESQNPNKYKDYEVDIPIDIENVDQTETYANNIVIIDKIPEIIRTIENPPQILKPPKVTKYNEFIRGFNIPVPIKKDNSIEMNENGKVIKDLVPETRIWAYDRPILTPKLREYNELKYVNYILNEIENDNQNEIYASANLNEHIIPEKRKWNCEQTLPIVELQKPTEYKDYVVNNPVDIVKENHTETHTSDKVIRNTAETKIWAYDPTSQLLRNKDYTVENPVEIVKDKHTETHTSEKVDKNQPETKIWAYEPASALLKYKDYAVDNLVETQIVKEKHTEMHTSDKVIRNIAETKIWAYNPTSALLKYKDYAVENPVEIVKENHSETYTIENVTKKIMPATKIWAYDPTSTLLKYKDYAVENPVEIVKENHTETHTSDKVIRHIAETKIWAYEPASALLKYKDYAVDIPVETQIIKENHTETQISEKVIRNKAETKIWAYDPTSTLLKNKDYAVDVPVEIVKENHTKTHTNEKVIKNIPETKIWAYDPTSTLLKSNDYAVDNLIEIVKENHTESHTIEKVLKNQPETRIWAYEPASALLKSKDYAVDNLVETVKETEMNASEKVKNQFETKIPTIRYLQKAYDPTYPLPKNNDYAVDRPLAIQNSNQDKMNRRLNGMKKEYAEKSLRICRGLKNWPPINKTPKPTTCIKRCRGVFQCKAFTEDRRQKICNYYWSLESEDQEKFILSCVKQEEPDCNPIGVTKRGKSKKYYFRKDGVYQRVCSAFFSSTLCISVFSVTNAFRKRAALLQTQNINQKPAVIVENIEQPNSSLPHSETQENKSTLQENNFI